MPRSIAVTLALLACFCAQTAVAGWPTPAAGDSASGAPEVLFTFDDGPHEKHSRVILDTLAAHGIKAIFYWVGHRVSGNGHKADARRALVLRAIAEGHIVGNHTVNHRHLCKIPAAQAAIEIDRTRDIYEQLTGMPVPLIRVPYGDRCKRVVALLAERNLTHLHWDIDSREYMHHDAKRVAVYIIARLKRLRGRAVVLMHDTQFVTAKALPVILDWIATENERRAERGDAPIRILTGSDYVAERIDPRLDPWVLGVVIDASAFLLREISKLVPGERLDALTVRKVP